MSAICTQAREELTGGALPVASEPRPSAVEFRYHQTDNFAPLLRQLNVSLLLTTYQANKLLVVRATTQGGLSTLVRTFERPMGLAVDGRRMALGTRDQIWFLRNAPDIAPRIEPAGMHDACYLPRSSHVTGDIGVHEMAWGGDVAADLQSAASASPPGRLQIGRHIGDDLWIVNTRFSSVSRRTPSSTRSSSLLKTPGGRDLSSESPQLLFNTGKPSAGQLYSTGSLPRPRCRPMSEVTRILSAIEQGDAHAAEQLLPLVYDELRRLARAKLAQEKPGQTLQATALVHEAYVRLVDVQQVQQWHSRGHFFAAAAEAMRRILVESARKRGRLKRAGDRQRLDLDSLQLSVPEVPDDLLALDEALTELAYKHPEKAELVKLRYFAGLTVSAAAQALGISTSTADRHWTYARAWLYRRIVGDAEL